MKTQQYHTDAFTLSEVLVAATLSVLILAMFLTLLVKTLGIWREGMARLQLSEHSRITRERILHGLDGQFGLRHASRAQLTYTTNQINFRDVSASNAFTLFLDANQSAAYSDVGGQHRLSQSRTFVDHVNITNDGNILNIDLTLAITNGWKKHTQSQQIRVYLLNE